MLNKIIKHDLKNNSKIFFPIYIGVIAASVFVMLLSFICNYSFDKEVIALNFASTMSYGIMFMILISMPVVSLILIIVRFYLTVASNEGYLTNTLPVSKRDIVIGKNIAGVIFYISSIILALILLFSITRISTNEPFNDIFYTIKSGISTVFSSDFKYKYEIISAFVLFILAALLQMYYNITFGFTCVSLGQMMRRNKIIWTLVFMFAITFGIQIISSVLISIFSFVSYNNHIFISSETMDLTRIVQNNEYIILTIIGLGAFIINTIICIVLTALTSKLLDKKLNLQ